MTIRNLNTSPKSFGRKKADAPQLPIAPMAKKKCYLENRKASERTKQLKKVQLIFNNNICTIDAILRSLSEEGAQVEVNNPLEIPDKFMLKFTSDFKTRQCQVVWRDDKSIGLKFVSP